MTFEVSDFITQFLMLIIQLSGSLRALEVQLITLNSVISLSADKLWGWSGLITGDPLLPTLCCDLYIQLSQPGLVPIYIPVECTTAPRSNLLNFWGVIVLFAMFIQSCMFWLLSLTNKETLMHLLNVYRLIVFISHNLLALFCSFV